jgi:hypothetical protein
MPEALELQPLCNQPHKKPFCKNKGKSCCQAPSKPELTAKPLIPFEKSRENI